MAPDGGNFSAASGCRWLHGVSVIFDPLDICGGVGQAEGVRGGVGMTNDVLERFLRVLEVGLPIFLSPVELRQLFKLRSFVRGAFLC